MVTPAPDREAFEQAIVRGSELLKQNQLDQAQRAFRAALELEPDSARVLALLGLAHFRAGEFAEARPIYEDLVERAPTDASHRLNLGLVYLKLNDAEHAINSLEASRALDPSQGRAVSYLGLAYARAGRYAEAYRSFLLANQNELASEIEQNLTPSERDGIHAQLQRSPSGPLARTLTPHRPPSGETPVARTVTPPAGNRAVSGELGAPSGDVAKPRTPTPPLPRTLTPPAVPESGEPRSSTSGPMPVSTSQELLINAWTTDDRPPPKDGLPAVARAITPAPARTITPHRGSRASGEIPIIPIEVVVVDPPPERDATEIPIVDRAPVEILPRTRPP
ncbi:MAG TPA: tetratricopeptide repeat protein, partial [Kofleriaceae bacterium]|nr:tetratricopeptide repeat protein [Kofleriaceae bacterium]